MTFGEFLRAARTGFHFSAKHDAYIRISDENKKPHKKEEERRFWVEVCPKGSLFKVTRESRMQTVEHYKLDEAVFAELPALETGRYGKYLLDYDGNVVERIV